MNVTELPPDLKRLIEDEKIDFLLKAQRNQPISKSFAGLFFGTIWLAFTSVFVFAFFGPLLTNEEVHFESNGEPVTASWEDLTELLVPGIFVSVFLIIGLLIMGYSFYSLFQKGGYFAGTETRLIQYRNGTSTITDWEQFTGNVKIKAKDNFGDLEYELRTGKMERRKNQADKFVPDIIYVSGIENIYEIEKKCKIRIKENDPTPAVLAN